jgi:hypothetical protein
MLKSTTRQIIKGGEEIEKKELVPLPTEQPVGEGEIKNIVTDVDAKASEILIEVSAFEDIMRNVAILYNSSGKALSASIDKRLTEQTTILSITLSEVQQIKDEVKKGSRKPKIIKDVETPVPTPSPAVATTLEPIVKAGTRRRRKGSTVTELEATKPTEVISEQLEVEEEVQKKPTRRRASSSATTATATNTGILNKIDTTTVDTNEKVTNAISYITTKGDVLTKVSEDTGKVLTLLYEMDTVSGLMADKLIFIKSLLTTAVGSNTETTDKLNKIVSYVDAQGDVLTKPESDEKVLSILHEMSVVLDLMGDKFSYIVSLLTPMHEKIMKGKSSKTKDDKKKEGSSDKPDVLDLGKSIPDSFARFSKSLENFVKGDKNRKEGGGGFWKGLWGLVSGNVGKLLIGAYLNHILKSENWALFQDALGLPKTWKQLVLNVADLADKLLGALQKANPLAQWVNGPTMLLAGFALRNPKLIAAGSLLVLKDSKDAAKEHPGNPIQAGIGTFLANASMGFLDKESTIDALTSRSGRFRNEYFKKHPIPDNLTERKKKIAEYKRDIEFNTAWDAENARYMAERSRRMWDAAKTPLLKNNFLPTSATKNKNPTSPLTLSRFDTLTDEGNSDSGTRITFTDNTVLDERPIETLRKYIDEAWKILKNMKIFYQNREEFNKYSEKLLKTNPDTNTQTIVDNLVAKHTRSDDLKAVSKALSNEGYENNQELWYQLRQEIDKAPANTTVEERNDLAIAAYKKLMETESFKGKIKPTLEVKPTLEITPTLGANPTADTSPMIVEAPKANPTPVVPSTKGIKLDVKNKGEQLKPTNAVGKNFKNAIETVTQPNINIYEQGSSTYAYTPPPPHVDDLLQRFSFAKSVHATGVASAWGTMSGN